eukprot:6199192-Pleurochrysis_carterae.AAC.4
MKSILHPLSNFLEPGSACGLKRFSGVGNGSGHRFGSSSHYRIHTFFLVSRAQLLLIVTAESCLNDAKLVHTVTTESVQTTVCVSREGEGVEPSAKTSAA